jgi:NADPH-dependent stearoyl-CoA 9-desaturase
MTTTTADEIPTAAAAAANGNPLHQLTPEQIEELGREFQAIHDEVYADLGEHDARYIRSMIQLQRRLAAMSRAVLIASRYRPAWALGTVGLSAAKILENMEIGHNVLHGQWDWMNDPEIHSSSWDWDTASPAFAWKHSHNYVHHTYTNIVGKDKDVGYEIMRVDPKQPWHPVYLLQPLYNLLLAALFEWGVAVHDLDFDAIRSGTKPKEQVRDELKGIATKARRQVVKDYIAWPVTSGLAMTAIEVAAALLFEPPAEADGRTWRPRARRGKRRRFDWRPVRNVRVEHDPRTLLGRLIARRSFREPFRATLTADLVANFVRNLWAYAIIFCGHFPDQAYTFTEEEVAGETQGGWYVRQLIGAANIEGGPFFHVMSGNLSYQVEHHLFPDMPSSRYQQIAPRVREICERYGLPYNTGPFRKQLGSVQRTLLRLAFPGGRERPKPGPWREPEPATGNGRDAGPASTAFP